MRGNTTPSKLIVAVLAVSLLLPGGSAYAKLPPEAANGSGYLIIGNFLIHRGAVNKDNTAAARASMADSGQGMFYQSELADGTWYDLGSASSVKDIIDPKSKKALPAAAVDKLKLEVWIDEKGTIRGLLPAAEAAKRVEQLAKDIEKLKEQNEEAVEDNKQSESTRLQMQQEQLEAEIAFLKAVEGGNQLLAEQLMARMAGDPAAILSSLQEKAAALAGSLGQEQQKLAEALKAAEAGGNAALVAELSAKLAETQAAAGGAAEPKSAADALAELALLQSRQAELEGMAYRAAAGGSAELAAELQLQAASGAAKLAAAQAAADALQQAQLQGELAALQPQLAAAQGDAALAAKLLAQAVRAEAQLKALESGLAAQLRSLEAALAKLQTIAALASGSAAAEPGTTPPGAAPAETGLPPAGLPAELADSWKQLTLQLLAAEKAQLFLQLDLAEQQTGNAAEAVTAQLIPQLQALQKEQYTAKQLAAIAELSSQIARGTDARAVPLPVESILTEGTSLSFEMPPVLIDGSAYIHIRPISEAFGSKVIWNDFERTVTILKEGTVLFCRVDDPEAYLNGNKILLDAPPRLVEGRTMVPLRFVAEGLGLYVGWDAPTATIRIEGLDG
jgi:hypothetical protein